MNRPDPDPTLHETRGGTSAADTTNFGFDLPDEQWIARVRSAEVPRALGRLGEYELLAEVGRGAQGVVYRARQQKPRREVALKQLIAGGLASPAVRARFEREVEAAAALNHPNIVIVFGMETIDGQPVLAMEWIDGVPVDRWAQSGPAGPRPLNERLAIFLQICDAIHHAHQRGVIHRDLKPSNILVDASGAPHVLDFGLAKLTTGDESDAARLTFTQEFVGTPAYASPEQLRQGAAGVDVRSDVYSLGVILYQLLTGLLPHKTDRGLTELLVSIQNIEPPRPSALNRGLDRELDVIVMKALAKDPAERYQSVDALAGDVSRYMAGEPILALPPSVTYQLRKLVRKHWLPFAFAGTVSLLVLAFGIVAGTLAMRLRVERDRAVQNEQGQREARLTAQRTNEFLRRMLASVDPAEALGRDVTVREMLDEAAQRVGTELADQPAVRAALQHTIGMTYTSLAEYELAGPHLSAALETRRELPDVPVEDLSESMQALGLWHQAKGDYAVAEPLLREAVELLRADPESSPAELCEALNNLGVLKLTTDEMAEADRLFQEALSLSPADSVQRAIVLKNLAEAARDLDQLERCEQLSRESYEVFRRLYGERHPETNRAKVALARVYQLQQQHDEAETLLREALAAEIEVQGPAHPDTLVTRGSLALLHQEMGRLAEAEREYREIIALRRERYADLHPELCRSLGNLAIVLQLQDRLEEAEQIEREALACLEQTLGAAHIETVTALHNVAALVRDQGRSQEAEPLFRRVCDAFEKAYGPGHRETVNAQNGLAMLVHDQGRIEDAIALYRSGLEARLAVAPADDMAVITTEFNLATALLDAGQPAEARDILARSLDTVRPILPAGHWFVANIQSWYGRALAETGDAAAAERELKAAAEALEAALGREHSRWRKAVERLVEFYSSAGRREDAAAWQARLDAVGE